MPGSVTIRSSNTSVGINYRSSKKNNTIILYKDIENIEKDKVLLLKHLHFGIEITELFMETFNEIRKNRTFQQNISILNNKVGITFYSKILKINECKYRIIKKYHIQNLKLNLLLK